MNSIQRLSLLLLTVCILPSCQQIVRDLTREVAIEVEGEFLYQDEIENFIPNNISKDDSLYLAESYKKQWVTQTLLYKKALRNIGNKKSIDQQAELYRKELIINQYQQQLIAEKLSDIPEDSLLAYYEKNKELFPLEAPVIKGIFIQLPTTSSDQADLKKWLSNTTDENLENIMRYCTQHAASHEFFLEKWTPYEKISSLMPQRIDANDPALTRGTIVQQQQEYSYYLRITGKCDTGTPQPYEMVKPKLHSALLNQEKIRFINHFQQELYNIAVKEGKVISHENESL